MEQVLSYKGVRYVIGSENGEGRSWAIYPEEDTEPAADGLARMHGARGSFKQAVIAARVAIDDWLVHHPDHEPGDDAPPAPRHEEAGPPPGPAAGSRR